MNKTIKVKIPDVNNFQEIWKEYDERTMTVFNEYYVHYTDKERKNKVNATAFEGNMHHKYAGNNKYIPHDKIEEYRNEMRQWHICKDYHVIPAPRFSDTRKDEYDTSIKDVTNSYISYKTIDDKLYAEIKILNTPKGKKYLNIDENKLELIPIIMGNKRIAKLIINDRETK